MTIEEIDNPQHINKTITTISIMKVTHSQIEK